MEEFTCVYCYVALEERSTEAAVNLNTFTAFQYLYFMSNKQ